MQGVTAPVPPEAPEGTGEPIFRHGCLPLCLQSNPLQILGKEGPWAGDARLKIDDVTANRIRFLERFAKRFVPGVLGGVSAWFTEKTARSTLIVDSPSLCTTATGLRPTLEY